MTKYKLTASEERVVNDETIRMLKERNKQLLPLAVRELRKRGFSWDSIAKLLNTGKVTAMRFKEKKEKPRR